MDFILNDHDTCVASKIINGAQFTITWHVDDLKISYEDSAVVDEVLKQLADKYSKLVTTQGTEHTYLGMYVDYSIEGERSISMIPYMTEVMEDFLEDIPYGAGMPAASHLLEESKDAVPFDAK